ncbi:ribonuclease III [Prevotella falsenii]|uniref:ribonuclease III n=1 Tax=Prevotella falsenii TaxID=515414 RepID=UPI0004698B27|nr:ribonuclease III [Prevotella falsenii]
MLNKFIDKIKLPFRKEKELYLSLYQIIGVLPHNLSYYKTALLHKSVARRNDKGKPVNNERLEFLGDAILDAIVGDIVYEHFPGKREGFLTNTRSKIVQRETLNKLANDLGITKLILSSGHSQSHNSYLGGNAFEALVGALYLDHGYTACMKFMKKQILGELINIDKVAYKEVNFKSKLIEWTQKHKVCLEFKPLSFGKDKEGNPTFSFQVVLENIACGEGKGYSKKESQQEAAKATLRRIRKEPKFADEIFEAKKNRLALEGRESSDTVETIEEEDLILLSNTKQNDTVSPVETQEQSSLVAANEKESIIAEAEAKAFQ